jgi:hypothetical protein
MITVGAAQLGPNAKPSAMNWRSPNVTWTPAISASRRFSISPPTAASSIIH